MHETMKGGLFVFLALGALPGCHRIQTAEIAGVKGAGVVALENDKRLAIMREVPATGSDGKAVPGDKRLRYCVEPVGPAFRLNSLDVVAKAATENGVITNIGGEGESKGGDKGKGSFQFNPYSKFEGEAGVRFAESLSTIYSVTEVMQLAHETNYRLCESYGDGSPAEYREDLMKVFDQTRRLLIAQALMNLPDKLDDARLQAILTLALTDQLEHLTREQTTMRASAARADGRGGQESAIKAQSLRETASSLDGAIKAISAQIRALSRLPETELAPAPGNAPLPPPGDPTLQNPAGPGAELTRPGAPGEVKEEKTVTKPKGAPAPTLPAKTPEEKKN